MTEPYIPEFKKYALAKEDSSVDWIYEQDSAKTGKAVCSLLKQLIADQSPRLFANTQFMSMYANTNFLSSYSGMPMPPMAYNLIKVCTDTLAGMLVQSNSRVVMNTTGGMWSDSKKARKIELAIEGEWSRMRYYKHAALVAIDAIVTGTGYMKLYRDNDTVACERVFPNEVFVDEAEAAYGPPSKMFQVRYVKKDTLARLYPDKIDIIQKASMVKPPNFPWTLCTTGLVEVCEAWALNRKHVLAINTGCLVDEPYPYDTFPIIPFHAGPKPFGWYGQGFAEQTFETQIVLNQTIAMMQDAASLGIAPYWVIQEGSSINHSHLNNEVGHVVETNSLDPKWVTNPPFHPDATAYVEQLAQIIMNHYGLNEMQTQGQVQTNRLDSRKALVEFQDIAATRHTTLLERWEDFFIESAKSTVSICRRIAKDKGGYPVVAKKDYQVAIHLDWRDLELSKNAHVFSPAPSSLLSRTPAGRINDIVELTEKGLISQSQGQKALRAAPDIDALVQEATALDDHIDYIIDRIVESEEYVPPDAFTATPHTINRVRNARLEFIGRNAPENVIALFDQWAAEATQILKAQQADIQAEQQAAALAAQQGAIPNGTTQGSAGAANNPTGQPAPGIFPS